MLMDPLTQPDYLDGKLIHIDGSTARLSESGTIYHCTASSHIFSQLHGHLNGPTIRAFGTATWLRDADGRWKLVAFSIENFRPLDDRPLHEVLK